MERVLLDGVGGALKCADKYVHRGGDLQSAKDLFNCLCNNKDKVVIRWGEEDKITDIDSLLPPTVCCVVGISNNTKCFPFHLAKYNTGILAAFASTQICAPAFSQRNCRSLCLKLVWNNTHKCHSTRRNWLSTNQKPAHLVQVEADTSYDDDTSYTMGNIVILIYADRPYVGMVTKICHSEAKSIAWNKLVTRISSFGQINRTAYFTAAIKYYLQYLRQNYFTGLPNFQTSTGWSLALWSKGF